MEIKEAIQHCREVTASYTEQGKCPECAADHTQLADWLEELVSYKDTMLTPDEIELMKEAQEIGDNMTPKRLAEILRAERVGRLVVLPVGVTRATLEGDLHDLEQRVDGDVAENYTTGYRNGHENGRMELLRYILGVSDGARQEDEAQRRKEDPK